VNDELRAKLDRLPRTPGVYIMRDVHGAVMYVGKATDLRARVRSYTTGHDTRAFVQRLNTWLHDVEVIVTQSAKEALLLENTLIKRHKPRHNVLLRDDKNYLSLRIDKREEWPRVRLVRQIRDDGAHYFGPYHSAQSARQTLNVLNRYFQLRTCPDAVLRNRARPCLQYQIRRCPAPCVLPVDRDAYMDNVHHASLFLSGREDRLVALLEEAMTRTAEALEFEDAARYRDQIQAVRESLQRQGAIQTSRVDRDVIGMHRDGNEVAVAVLMFRGGSLVDVATFGLEEQLLDDSDLMAAFISRFYASEKRAAPSEIVAPVPVFDSDALSLALSEIQSSRVSIHTPKSGERKRLVETATANAMAYFEEHLTMRARAGTVLSQLQRTLGLKQAPRVIECYDVSNFQGKHVVASQVVFVDAVAAPSMYRQYRIRTFVGQDDFASMFEILTRRAKRARDGSSPMPDLVLIDGGLGQLNMARRALAEQGFEDQEIAALAKARTRVAAAGKRSRSEESAKALNSDAADAAIRGPQGATTERTPERVFLPGRKNPVVLKPGRPDGLLLERIRDEAHRFAITFHRKLRSKGTFRTKLDDIPGVGPARRKELLRHFGSVRALRGATLAELEAVDGVGRRLAAQIFAHFHPDEIDPPSCDES